MRPGSSGTPMPRALEAYVSKRNAACFLLEELHRLGSSWSNFWQKQKYRGEEDHTCCLTSWQNKNVCFPWARWSVREVKSSGVARITSWHESTRTSWRRVQTAHVTVTSAWEPLFQCLPLTAIQQKSRELWISTAIHINFCSFSFSLCLSQIVEDEKGEGARKKKDRHVSPLALQYSCTDIC